MFIKVPQNLELIKLDATLVSGHGIASGISRQSPYPRGSIEIQKPFFKKLGLDLGCFWNGTLNLFVHNKTFELINPDYSFNNVSWTNFHQPEDFSFWNITIICNGTTRPLKSMIYKPSPNTKLLHHQSEQMIEVLSHRINNLEIGSKFIIYISNHKIKFK